MSDVRCSVCGVSPKEDGAAVYRNNPKGERPDWRCKSHLGKKRNIAIAEMVDAIERFQTYRGIL